MISAGKMGALVPCNKPYHFSSLIRFRTVPDFHHSISDFRFVSQRRLSGSQRSRRLKV